MSNEDKKEQKEAYLDALKVSPVERSVLKQLHKVNDNQLDKWLYVQDRYPSFRACWELWMLLNGGRMIVSSKLDVLIKRSMNRASKTVEKLPLSDKTDNDIKSFQYTNESLSSVNEYVFNGRLVSVSDVFREMGFRVPVSLYTRIKKEGILPGSDISHLARLKSGMSEFIYNGKRVTLKKLSSLTGISASKLRVNIKKAGMYDGCDISELKFSKTHGRAHIYRYHGEGVTRMQLAKRLNLSVQTIGVHIVRAGKKNGDDVSDVFLHLQNLKT